jgi:hypothetical protein
MRISLLVRTVAAASFCASSAHAQVATRPAVEAGDEWRFAVYYTVPTSEPSRTWRIVSVGAERIEATEDGEPLTLTPELNVLDSPRSSESNPRALSFPMEVGMAWRYRSDWVFKPKKSNGSFDVDVRVVSYEKVRVPAGEFDAFRLVSTAAISGTSPVNSRYEAEARTTYWYAPAARAIVRSIHHNPYLGTSTVELVSLRLRH